MKHGSLLLLALFLGLFASHNYLYGEAASRIEEVPDPVFITDVPIMYGEEAFLQRINQRTEGQREPLGLVLSGGSARAFAHIGTLKYLEDNNIVPDFIVANSMGSIVALLYAAGFSPDQIYQIVENTPINKLFRPTLLIKSGVLDVSAFLSLLYLYTGPLQIEDLAIPVMIATEDLVTKRAVLFSEGDFFRVMQASFALPVFFPPVKYRGHRLIDGGVINLVPLEYAYRYTPVVFAATAFYSNSKINLSNPLSILRVSIDIGKGRTGVQQIKEMQPLLFRSQVETFSYMEFDRLFDIYNAGYNSIINVFDPASFLLRAAWEKKELVLPEEIAALRAIREQRIREVQYHIGDGQRIEAFKPSWNLFPRIAFSGFPGDQRYLKEDIFAGANLEAKVGGWYGRITGGGLWDYTEKKIQPVTSLQTGWFNGRFFHLSGFGQIQFERSDYSIGNIYAHGLVESSWQRNSGPNLRGTSIFEAHWEDSTAAPRTLKTTSVTLDFGSVEKNLLSLEAGWQLLDLSDHLVFGDLFSQGRTEGIYIRNRMLGKYSISPERDAVVYHRDGLYTSRTPDRWLIADTLRFGLNPKNFRPTLAETIILKNFEFGVYSELGYGDTIFWGAGVEGTMTISLIGLSDALLSASIGYDAYSEGLHSRIYLSSSQ